MCERRLTIRYILSALSTWNYLQNPESWSSSFLLQSFLCSFASYTPACGSKKKSQFADHHSLSDSLTTLKEAEQLKLHGNLMPVYEWETNIHIIVVVFLLPGHLFCSETCLWAPSWPAWWRRCLAWWHPLPDGRVLAGLPPCPALLDHRTRGG